MSILYLPFNTYERQNPDFNQADSAHELSALTERQNQMIQVVDGELEAEALFETLAAQGIEPTDYVETVCENVEHLIRVYG